MITQNLRINQLSAAAFENYLSYLRAIDGKDIETYGKFLADDISVQFNNDQPMQGKETVLQGLGYYWQSFGSVEHDLTNIYGRDTAYVLEAQNHYVRKDGKMATVKAVAFTDLNDHGLVESVRIYQDVSPVFA
ncbi:nuclear transport factor 2 family protein [Flavitalea antarctica]